MLSILTRRAIAFVVALVLAILAAVAAYSYLRGVENRAAEEADAVIGYVATQPIEPGTLADTAIQLGAIEEREIPRTLLAPDAVTDLSQVTGRVVEQAILPGDQIISTRFAAPGQQARVLAIPPDHQAMSIEVQIPPGVAGFLSEGDRIGVIAYLDVPAASGETVTVEDEEQGTATEQAATESRAQYALQDVEVLAVGRRVIETPQDETTDAGATAPTSTVLLTLAVTADEAERLAFAVLDGSVYLTLLPEDQPATGPTGGVTAESIFDVGN